MDSYDKIEDVEKKNPICGLYLFSYTKNNNSYCKIGMTSRRIHKRLYEYRNQGKFEPTEIIYIETKSPRSIETGIINYLNYKEILPIKGREYFEIKHRDILETVLLLADLYNDYKSANNKTVDEGIIYCIEECRTNPKFISYIDEFKNYSKLRLIGYIMTLKETEVERDQRLTKVDKAE